MNEAWKTFEEIEPGLYWLTQTNITGYTPEIVEYYLSAYDATPYIRFMCSGNRFPVSELLLDVLRFVAVVIPNVGRPGTGSGPNGEVTTCDEHYELGEQ